MAGREPAARGELRGVLVLARKPKQSIMIGDDIEVTVLSTQGEKVRLGIQAPAGISVHRTEIYMAIQQQREQGGVHEGAGSEIELDGPPRPIQ
jgi:carbon storage regulator